MELLVNSCGGGSIIAFLVTNLPYVLDSKLSVRPSEGIPLVWALDLAACAGWKRWGGMRFWGAMFWALLADPPRL